MGIWGFSPSPRPAMVTEPHSLSGVLGEFWGLGCACPEMFRIQGLWRLDSGLNSVQSSGWAWKANKPCWFSQLWLVVPRREHTRNDYNTRAEATTWICRSKLLSKQIPWTLVGALPVLVAAEGPGAVLRSSLRTVAGSQWDQFSGVNSGRQ